jgi:putative hydrolase of the HAD superfamily
VHDPALIETLSVEMWDAWVLDAQVLALVDRVRQRYRVAMLSNATDALDGVLAERYCVADRFEFIGNSARLGVAKPNPAAFQAVLERLQLKPEEVVFVDDRADNITAAAALGLHVIWFVNAHELERQLQVYLASPLKGNGAAAAASGDEDTG